MMVKEKNYLINEAAKEVHVESHVLRYWEEELRLPIKRNEQGASYLYTGGHRHIYYSQKAQRPGTTAESGEDDPG